MKLKSGEKVDYVEEKVGEKVDYAISTGVFPLQTHPKSASYCVVSSSGIIHLLSIKLLLFQWIFVTSRQNDAKITSKFRICMKTITNGRIGRADVRSICPAKTVPSMFPIIQLIQTRVWIYSTM